MCLSYESLGKTKADRTIKRGDTPKGVASDCFKGGKILTGGGVLRVNDQVLCEDGEIFWWTWKWLCVCMAHLTMLAASFFL